MTSRPRASRRVSANDRVEGDVAIAEKTVLTLRKNCAKDPPGQQLQLTTLGGDNLTSVNCVGDLSALMKPSVERGTTSLNKYSRDGTQVCSMNKEASDKLVFCEARKADWC